ncbi:ABC transporter ATP-binding protein [Patescibacteria group bacterium]
MAIIEVNNLIKKFNNTVAVNDVSFSIPENKIFGLLGANGAGKSTTINILTGLLLPTSGQVTIMGLDIRKKIEKIRKNIALVPQTLSLYDDLTVFENLDFFGGLYIKKHKLLKQRMKEMIDVFALEEYRNYKISKLSGGYQRRVSIACALISQPRILFLDEPLTGIDVYTNKIIKKLLRSLDSMTVILTTHSMRVAEDICNHVVYFEKGKKILDGSPEHLINHFSKKVGEHVVVELEKRADVDRVKGLIEKARFNISNLEAKSNRITFNSPDIGYSIVTVLDSLKPVKDQIINIDIKKPNLEFIITNILNK